MSDEGAGPDWSLWGNLPEVELWQACALSLNIEPDGMRFSRNAWMAGPGDHPPIFERETFRDATQQAEFGKRLRLVIAHRPNRTHFSPGTIHMSQSHRHGVRLPEFAAWAKGISLSLPDDFPGPSFPLRAPPQSATKSSYEAATESSASPLPLVVAELPDDRPAYVVREALDIAVRTRYPEGAESDSVVQWVSAIESRKAYFKLLDSAVNLQGTIKVLDPMSQTAHTFPIGESLETALIPRDELQKFALRFLRIELKVPTREADREELAGPGDKGAATNPVQRFAAQDAQILECLRANGHEPKRLQKNVQGKRGVKAETNVALSDSKLFVGKTVFNKAWERLALAGDISYE